MLPPADLDRSFFDPHLHSRFRMATPSGSSLELELVSITSLAPIPGIRRAPFSLLFRSSEKSAQPQRIYALQHDELGELEIFLVPIGPDEEGMQYQAIFS